MTLGIMQPYFLPYIGYFQLIKAVDEYVIYDDVNFIKGGWINRNNLLIGGQKKMFTISLKAASPYRKINEIDICDDFSKFIRTLELNYAKAPYFEQVMQLIGGICRFEDKNLARFIANSLHRILGYLDIATELSLSSDLDKNCSLCGQDKVIDICKHLSATSYLNAIGGMELYDKKAFRDNGIDLFFLNPQITPYKQGKYPFVPGLSIIDVLMYNPVEEANAMLDKYTLI